MDYIFAATAFGALAYGVVWSLKWEKSVSPEKPAFGSSIFRSVYIFWKRKQNDRNRNRVRRAMHQDAIRKYYGGRHGL